MSNSYVKKTVKLVNGYSICLVVSCLSIELSRLHAELYMFLGLGVKQVARRTNDDYRETAKRTLWSRYTERGEDNNG